MKQGTLIRLSTLAIIIMKIYSGDAEKVKYLKKVHFLKPPFIANTLHERPAKIVSYSKKTIIPVDYPSYEFGYRIHDPQHQNYQEKTEIRKGDEVQGFYSLLQPNGVIRVVRYHTDDEGFHSKVSLHKSRHF